MKLRINWFQAAAVLIACVAAWPLMGEAGLLNTRGGGDSPFLLQRLHQMEVALRDGHFPVRWMPDANYGYGYPFFNFYAPLAFYAAAIFRFLGFSFVNAIQLSQLAAFLVAAVGMFQLARRWFHSDWGALLASVAYTLAPFHLANVYVRGDSIAEFWAMAFYPLVILAVSGRRLAVGKQHPANSTLSLSYAALILSHNISAMIFTPFLLLWLGVRGWWLGVGEQGSAVNGQRSAVSASYPSSLILYPLALALAAWFWLPALWEQDLTQLGGVTIGFFNFSNHFRGLDLVQPSFFYDASVGGGRAFRMGLIQALLIGIAVILTWRHFFTSKAKTDPVPWFILAGFAIATFMITSLSSVLWEGLPLLPFTQFPWRFLSIQAFFGALLIGLPLKDAPIYHYANSQFHLPPILVAAAISLMLISSLGRLQLDHLPLADGDVTAAALAEYEWFTGNIGTTVSAEYLPPEVNPRPYTSGWVEQGAREQARILAGEATAVPQTLEANFQHWRVSATSDATLLLPTLYWAGWQAELNGQPIALTAAPHSGLMQLRVPPGEHALEVWLGRTPIRQAAELISLAALLWLLVSGGYALWQSGAWRALGRRLALGLLAFGLIAAVMLALQQRPQTEDSAVATWDFGEMAYLHPQPDGIPYGNGAHLGAYAISAETAEAGGQVDITLNWVGQPEGDVRQVTLALTTPATNRFHFVPPIASQTQPLTQGAVTYSFEIPSNAPAGLYVPTLTLSDRNRPRTPAGKLRGQLFLRPIRILPSAAVDQPAERALDVAAVEVFTKTEDLLELRLAWRTARPLAQNLKMSLRLVQADGVPVFEAQFDNQPGYGYQPSLIWPPEAWVNDWLTLRLPESLQPATEYVVLVRLYEAGEDDERPGKTLLTRRLGELVWQDEGFAFRPNQPNYALPDELTRLDATLVEGETAAPIFALRGYQLQQSDSALDLQLFWQSLSPTAEDYTHFVHLLDPATGQPVAQHDAMPRNNSYPTSQWTTAEIVEDPARLSLEGVPPGRYWLTTGFYTADGLTFPRLQALDTEGDVYPNHSIILQEIVIEN